ncbi:hypothetical protein D3C80_1981050 [compost metagenome]
MHQSKDLFAPVAKRFLSQHTRGRSDRRNGISEIVAENGYKLLPKNPIRLFLPKSLFGTVSLADQLSFIQPALGSQHKRNTRRVR